MGKLEGGVKACSQIVKEEEGVKINWGGEGRGEVGSPSAAAVVSDGFHQLVDCNVLSHGIIIRGFKIFLAWKKGD